MLGGVVGALRWGLPRGHLAGQAPWLLALHAGLDMVISYVEERFLSEHLKKAPAPVSFETFETTSEDDEEPLDPWLARFLEMQRYMQDLAQLEGPPALEESYERYKEWLPFAHRNRAFFEASARDLGYELYELDHSPGERLF
jgi:hypothetical protein